MTTAALRLRQARWRTATAIGKAASTPHSTPALVRSFGLLRQLAPSYVARKAVVLKHAHQPAQRTVILQGGSGPLQPTHRCSPAILHRVGRLVGALHR